jgi:hypothetical protein
MPQCVIDRPRVVTKNVHENVRVRAPRRRGYAIVFRRTAMY